MKQLPCIEQYVLGKSLKSIITMTNSLTDMIFDALTSKELKKIYKKIRITTFKCTVLSLNELWTHYAYAHVSQNHWLSLE